MRLLKSPLSDLIKPVLVRARVQEQKPLSVGYFHLTLIPNAIIPPSYPGQFFMLGFPGRLDPLLKRPFGAFKRNEGTIEFFYQVRGKMTALMGELKEGEELEVFGPLGNFYPKPKSRTALIIAGGSGIASVYPLIESLKGKAIIIYGGKCKNDLPLANEITEKKLAKELILTTEDGSLGKEGTVLHALKGRLAASKDPRSYTLYACGPPLMMKRISELVRGEYPLEGYFSMEAHMACGTGVCLGCAVKTKTGYKRACQEGPIFNIREVAFEET
jgi:dihydroorotate dehydrogenase electron transfer subunit